MFRFFSYFLSFVGLVAGVIIFTSDRVGTSLRAPASTNEKERLTSEQFIQSVITTRELQKVLKIVIDTSNSLFFINSQPFLCFELGKMQAVQNRLSQKYESYHALWPATQSESVLQLIEKSQKDWEKLCKFEEKRNIKVTLVQFGTDTKLTIHSVYQDEDFALNYREYFEQLEMSVDKTHHTKTLKSIKAIKAKIEKIDLKPELPSTELCYQIGFEFFDYYVLNTSYLDSSIKKTESFLTTQRKVGRMIKELGPLCQRANNQKVLKKVQDIQVELKKLDLN